MLNRTLHKERTIIQWLSFDEPESRLKKATKRGEFEPGKGDHSLIQANNLAALAFAVEDIDRFKTISFKRVLRAIESNPQCKGFLPAQTLDKIHPEMSRYLLQSLTPEELIWASLCVEFLSPALQTFADDDYQQEEEGDPIAFLLKVSSRINISLDQEDLTECGALFELAQKTFQQHFEEMKTELLPEFLPEKLLIVEGQTEAILIPLFARLSDFEFAEQRILMISGGGANQVAKRFLTFRETTQLPIACVLDGDAETQNETISQHLGDEDLLFSLPSGEFEDTFEISSFIQLLNRYLQSMSGENAPSLIEFEALKKEQFSPLVKRTVSLNKIWREKSLGDFDKVEFASFVAENLKSKSDIPEDFKLMIQELKEKWTHEEEISDSGK